MESAIVLPGEEVLTLRDRVKPTPFLKWAGGKRRLLPELRKRIPANFESYFEPFLGGGALFFAVSPSKAILSDINQELILAYQVVRDDLAGLIRQLSLYKNNRRHFYKVRDLDRRGDFWTFSPLERACRFIYLNKTCFNGLCRVNSDGHFNVPYGQYKNPTIADPENLFACSQALRDVEVVCGPYERALSAAKKNDFVYLDPPYVPLTLTSSFVSYAKDGFSVKDQQNLRDCCISLDKRGVKFMLTNSDTPLVRELYEGFNFDSVISPRSVSADGNKRTAAKDLIVRNYLT